MALISLSQDMSKFRKAVYREATRLSLGPKRDPLVGFCANAVIVIIVIVVIILFNNWSVIADTFA